MSDPAQPPSWPVLSPLDRRLLGVLVEKQKTTPDVYPMSLNALVTGCNQKNNRDPLMSVEDHEVEAALEGLQKAGPGDAGRERPGRQVAALALRAMGHRQGGNRRPGGVAPPRPADRRANSAAGSAGWNRLTDLDALRAVCQPTGPPRSGCLPDAAKAAAARR